MSRTSSLVAAFSVAALVMAPALADARAGGGGSMGSRGGRTYSAPPMTNTAPSAAAPMERSMTPRSAPAGQPSYGQPGYAQQGGFNRGGFGTAVLGGLLGAGIGGLLLGHGVFGSGGFGFIGFLLQLALLFFVGRWIFRMFSRRPAMAGAGMGGLGGSFARVGQPAGVGGMPARPVTVSAGDYQAFEQTLKEVQAAWSAQDLRRMQTVATPEMVSYFGEQLAEQSSKGVINTVTDVRLQQGDLSEAWSEGNREYATVAMRFSMIDVTRDSTGRIVDGNPAEHVSATELWTFVRAPGGRWLLSAIQQAR